jgi:hypothetical protein
MAKKGIKEEERERKNECLGMLGEGERESKVMVRLCWVSSLGMLGERDIGKEEEREGEREIQIRGEQRPSFWTQKS